MIGQTIGDYRVVEKLGEGGFGVVYLATDTVLGRKVAVKTLDVLLTRDPKFRDRFFEEAQTQAQLQHPNIVTVFRFLEHEGQYYIVMEYLGGIMPPGGTRQGTLADLIKRGPVPQERLFPLFHQLLDAVGYAHSHGVLHRDLKPLNVLFTELGHPKVADFGIAKVLAGESSVSVSGHRVGTPAYMSPEQVLDKKLTRASDIYSLGCVLYEMAVGRLPFKESDTSSLFEAHLQEPPVPPRQVNAQTTERLEQVILKAMQKKSADRFQTCGEFAAALEVTEKVPHLQPSSVKVPSLIGVSRESALQVVASLGQRLEAEQDEYSDATPAGIVLAQEPAPGSEAVASRVVRVRLSRGRRPTTRDADRTRPELPSDRHEQTISSSQTRPEPRLESARPKRRASWIVASILAGIATAAVIVALAGGKRRADSNRQPLVGEEQPAASGSRTALSGVKSLGPNSRGYEEILWLKDSSVMTKIPAGAFTMGANDGEDNERPAHQVYLDEYYIDKYEVTNRQYKRFCDAQGWSYPTDPGFRGMPGYFTNYPNYPLTGVSWNDAKAYCEWAGKRLPTEAEWEKAARGLDERTWPWGGLDSFSTRCNRYFDDDGYQWTAPVGSFPKGASPYGCLDMAGNVWEWCNDWYDADYYGRSPTRNPRGPSTGSDRVHRGGDCYATKYVFVSCTYRSYQNPSGSFGGFRCVLASGKVIR